MPELTIPLEKLAFLILKAYEADAEVEPVNPEDASDQVDDAERQVLEDRKENGSYQELRDALFSLNSDELDEVGALRLVGRGDYDAAEWNDALAAMREAPEGRSPSRLLADPLLGTYLEDALDEIGLSIEGPESEHL
ncbi:MAG TPA: DUF3775 domain-containing protein [Stellaceae bacterium]|nr:DUF3775 domain-containing protein [Stellaceae bacterium]